MKENNVRLGKRITPSSNNLMAYLSCGTLCIAHCACSTIGYDNTYSVTEGNRVQLDGVIVYSR